MATVLHRQPEHYPQFSQKESSGVQYKPAVTSPLSRKRRVIHSSSSSSEEDETISSSSTEVFRCNDCGKKYKHPNCLTKHQWEHSKQWEYTSKFLLTKHQQVQMLEAASILINMKSSSSHKRKNSSIMDTNHNKKLKI